MLKIFMTNSNNKEEVKAVKCPTCGCSGTILGQPAEAHKQDCEKQEDRDVMNNLITHLPELDLHMARMRMKQLLQENEELNKMLIRADEQLFNGGREIKDLKSTITTLHNSLLEEVKK